MKPSDFSRLFGVSIETLRNYETQGILNPVRVKNARSYTAGDLLSTIMLLRLKRFGMHYDQSKKYLSNTSVNSQLDQTIRLEVEFQKKLAYEQIKLLFLQETILKYKTALINKDHFWIDVLDEACIIPFAEGTDAQNTEIQLDDSLFPYVLDHVECTNSELYFTYNNNVLTSQWQLSMTRELAVQIPDKVFCNSETRKEHRVLCTCAEVLDYNAIGDIVANLVNTARQEYHLYITSPEVVVQPIFVTSQESNSFIGKFNLVID